MLHLALFSRVSIQFRIVDESGVLSKNNVFLYTSVMTPVLLVCVTKSEYIHFLRNSWSYVPYRMSVHL
jgi:hypothetical protein